MSAEQPDSTYETSKQQPLEPFGDRFLWEKAEHFVTVGADRSLGSTLRRMRDEDARGVVVVRTVPDNAEAYYYVFRRSELERLAKDYPDRKEWTIGRAMDVHEWTSSMTSRSGRPTGPAYGRDGPAAGRIVDFDAVGRVVAIGERLPQGDGGCLGQIDYPDDALELGSIRGGVREPRTAAPATYVRPSRRSCGSWVND
jgi:uncharacterized protein associated with vWA-MoxR-VMAP ternary system